MLDELFRVLKPGGLLILTFNLAVDPRRFEDELRVEIFSPQSLVETPGRFGLRLHDIDDMRTRDSAGEIQQDRVAGIPEGMTVGGVALRKLE
jgi:hypothetical protein